MAVTVKRLKTSHSAPQRTRHIYLGSFVHTPTLAKLEALQETAVGVDEDGIIQFIKPTAELTRDQDSIVEPGFDPLTTQVHSPTSATQFYFPGFIDTHTHAAQYPNAGIFGNSTLLDWLDTYTFPLEASYTSLARAQHIYQRAVARSLSHGTTCAAYYATVHAPATNLLASICLDKGQRALVGRVCMTRMSPTHYQDESPAAAVAATQECIAHCESIDPAGHTVRPVITPRFAPSCCADTLAALGALAQASAHAVQTHISENQSEIALVATLFPDADSYTHVYERAQLLGERTILAHAVHLSDAEIKTLAATRTGVSHCPASNTALTSGACNVRKLLDAGVRVGLGTDVSGGFSSSVLEMVRQAMLVSRHVAMTEGDRYKLNLPEALYLATRGGAEMVGLGDRVGVFEVGKSFDAQLITLNDYEWKEEDEQKQQEDGKRDKQDDEEEGAQTMDKPCDYFGWETWEDRVAKWVWGGDDRNVGQVWIGGRLVGGTWTRETGRLV